MTMTLIRIMIRTRITAAIPINMIGIISLFCGVTNCPVTSIILSIELFGSDGIVYFFLSCALSYMLSGNFGLYEEQEIRYSKLKLEKIDRKIQ